jgi:hypothetical protein
MIPAGQTVRWLYIITLSGNGTPGATYELSWSLDSYNTVKGLTSGSSLTLTGSLLVGSELAITTPVGSSGSSTPPQCFIRKSLEPPPQAPIWPWLFGIGLLFAEILKARRRRVGV